MTTRESAQYLREQISRLSAADEMENTKAIQAINTLLNHYYQASGEGPTVQQLWAAAEKTGGAA